MARLAIFVVVLAFVFAVTFVDAKNTFSANKMVALAQRLQKMKSLGGYISCDACQLIIGWSESQLATNATEADIEKFVDNDLCSHIPVIVRAECENIVNSYTPELVSILLSRENPTTACDQLGLCSTN